MKKFISILTVLLFVFALSTNYVKAAGPAATLTTPGGGVTSISGTPTTHGREAGAHSIAITAATKSYVISDAIENQTFADLINVAITEANDDMTIVIGGKTLVIDVADTTAATTLAEVAADIDLQLDAALAADPALALTVTVSVEGTSPNKYLKILVDKAGLSNSISTISGGAATSLLFDNAVVAGVDAKALDTFTAATNSSGTWVDNNGDSNTLTVSHTTAPGTESTLTGLKDLIIVADTFIEGITLAAAGALSEGTALITVATGDVDSVTLTQEPALGYIYQNFALQPIVSVKDIALNGIDASDVTIAAYSDACTTPADTDFDGTLTVATEDGVATFSGVKYNTVNLTGIYLGAAVGAVTDCSALFKIYGSTAGTSTSSSTAATTTTTAPQTTTTTAPTTTTTSAAITAMPLPVKPIAEMNQAEKNTYTMSLQQFLINLLVQLLNLIKAQKGL